MATQSSLDPDIKEILLNQNRNEEEAEKLSEYFSKLNFFNKLMDSFGEAPADIIVENIWKTIKYEEFH